MLFLLNIAEFIVSVIEGLSRSCGKLHDSGIYGKVHGATVDLRFSRIRDKINAYLHNMRRSYYNGPFAYLD